MFTTIDKAITAWIGSSLAILTAMGINVDTLTQWETWVAPAVVGLFTWLFPNAET